MILLQHGLILAAILFVLGLSCLLIRRNLLFMLIGLEIMINSTALAFVVAGSYWGQADGQVMYILTISLAAAEASIDWRCYYNFIVIARTLILMKSVRCADEFTLFNHSAATIGISTARILSRTLVGKFVRYRRGWFGRFGSTNNLLASD